MSLYIKFNFYVIIEKDSYSKELCLYLAPNFLIFKIFSEFNLCEMYKSYFLVISQIPNPEPTDLTESCVKSEKDSFMKNTDLIH